MDFPLVSKHIVKSRNPLSTVDKLSSCMKSFHCNSVFRRYIIALFHVRIIIVRVIYTKIILLLITITL